MKNQKLYIKSSEFDFLKEPSFIKDYQIIKRGWSELMVANLENPISIWHKNKLHSYTKALLKPRYYFSSFKKISKKPIEVNIASFDSENINNFNLKTLEIIGFGDLNPA